MRERDTISFASPSLCCEVEFCLSHQSSGCWSTPCYFFQIPTHFAFQLIRLENIALGSKTCWALAYTVDPSRQYRLALSDKLYLLCLSVLWLGTSLILGYDWYRDSKEIKIGSHCFCHKQPAAGFSRWMILCITGNKPVFLFVLFGD